MAFTFKLERQDGTPAEPATLKTAVPDWRPGDTIPLGRDGMLRVVDTRLDESFSVFRKDSVVVVTLYS